MNYELRAIFIILILISSACSFLQSESTTKFRVNLNKKDAIKKSKETLEKLGYACSVSDNMIYTSWQPSGEGLEIIEFMLEMTVEQDEDMPTESVILFQCRKRDRGKKGNGYDYFEKRAELTEIIKYMWKVNK